jgi:hypothetical protein
LSGELVNKENKVAYSQVPRITCDFPGCEKVKGKENGWFLILENEFMQDSINRLGEINLIIVPFSESEARIATQHGCGVTHTLQLAATIIGRWSRGSTLNEGHSSEPVVSEPRIHDNETPSQEN